MVACFVSRWLGEDATPDARLWAMVRDEPDAFAARGDGECACSHCGARFASRSQLFARHLRDPTNVACHAACDAPRGPPLGKVCLSVSYSTGRLKGRIARPSPAASRAPPPPGDDVNDDDDDSGLSSSDGLSGALADALAGAARRAFPAECAGAPDGAWPVAWAVSPTRAPHAALNVAAVALPASLVGASHISEGTIAARLDDALLLGQRDDGGGVLRVRVRRCTRIESAFEPARRCEYARFVAVLPYAALRLRSTGSASAAPPPGGDRADAIDARLKGAARLFTGSNAQGGALGRVRSCRLPGAWVVAARAAVDELEEAAGDAARPSDGVAGARVVEEGAADASGETSCDELYCAVTLTVRHEAHSSFVCDVVGAIASLVRGDASEDDARARFFEPDDDAAAADAADAADAAPQSAVVQRRATTPTTAGISRRRAAAREYGGGGATVPSIPSCPRACVALVSPGMARYEQQIGTVLCLGKSAWSDASFGEGVVEEVATRIVIAWEQATQATAIEATTKSPIEAAVDPDVTYCVGGGNGGGCRRSGTLRRWLS